MNTVHRSTSRANWPLGRTSAMPTSEVLDSVSYAPANDVSARWWQLLQRAMESRQELRRSAPWHVRSGPRHDPVAAPGLRLNGRSWQASTAEMISPSRCCWPNSRAAPPCSAATRPDGDSVGGGLTSRPGGLADRGRRVRDRDRGSRPVAKPGATGRLTSQRRSTSSGRACSASCASRARSRAICCRKASSPGGSGNPSAMVIDRPRGWMPTSPAPPRDDRSPQPDLRLQLVDLGPDGHRSSIGIVGSIINCRNAISRRSPAPRGCRAHGPHPVVDELVVAVVVGDLAGEHRLVHLGPVLADSDPESVAEGRRDVAGLRWGCRSYSPRVSLATKMSGGMAYDCWAGSPRRTVRPVHQLLGPFDLALSRSSR